MMTIYPTHSCFDDTVANMVSWINKDRSLLINGNLLIVHGIIAPDGKLLVHAWLELNGNRVIDSGMLNGEKITFDCDLQEFYRESKVVETTKYTPFQAYHAEKEAGHYGPWVQKYRDMLK